MQYKWGLGRKQPTNSRIMSERRSPKEGELFSVDESREKEKKMIDLESSVERHFDLFRGIYGRVNRTVFRGKLPKLLAVTYHKSRGNSFSYLDNGVEMRLKRFHDQDQNIVDAIYDMVDDMRQKGMMTEKMDFLILGWIK